MKVFVAAFFICIVAAFGEELELTDHEKKTNEMLKACAQEMKLDPLALNDEKFFASKADLLNVEACLKACVDKKLGLLNADGTYNLESILSLVETPELKQKILKRYNNEIKECTLKVGKDPCKLAACVHRMPKSVYMKKE